MMLGERLCKNLKQTNPHYKNTLELPPIKLLMFTIKHQSVSRYYLSLSHILFFAISVEKLLDFATI